MIEIWNSLRDLFVVISGIYRHGFCPATGQSKQGGYQTPEEQKRISTERGKSNQLKVRTSIIRGKSSISSTKVSTTPIASEIRTVSI